MAHGDRNKKMVVVTESWEANEHRGMVHQSYRGMEGDILSLNRFVVEIHRRTVNDMTAWGGTQPNDVNQAEQRQHARDERQCCYSMAKKKEKREDR
jgi:hypothetical protein